MSVNRSRGNIEVLPGAVLSYSAGRRGLNPYTFRIVRPAANKLQCALRFFPEIGSFLGDKPPLMVNCYPAVFGMFDGTVSVDTYVRPETFSRALLLACDQSRSVIMLAQPLVAMEFILLHERMNLSFPRNIVICVGGYVCPASLQSAMEQVTSRQGSAAAVMHAYGVAEIDAACLLGMKRSQDGGVIFHRASDEIVPVVKDGKLKLKCHDDPGSVLFDTSDEATEVDGGIVIGPRNQKVASELETWSTALWERRTGHIGFVHGRMELQLRSHVTRPLKNERMFHRFAERHAFSWLNKPAWA